MTRMEGLWDLESGMRPLGREGAGKTDGVDSSGLGSNGQLCLLEDPGESAANSCRKILRKTGKGIMHPLRS